MSSSSSFFNLSLFLKYILSTFGYSFTMIKYLLLFSFTCTSEKRFELLSFLIITFVYSLFGISGISSKSDTIAFVSVKLLPWISNKVSFENKGLLKKYRKNNNIKLNFEIF